MSNSLAIAAVTATLRDLLLRAAQPLPGDPSSDTELADLTVTTRTPDKARTAEDRNQLNIFLYQTAANAALRNRAPGRPGETAHPPLALSLYYLVTAYGRGGEELLGHRLLGRAMSIMHDQGNLLPSDIKLSLPGNDLHLQLERVRIAPHHLSSEEMSKLWTLFQTQYRLSMVYEASVVLIDSIRPAKAPLPVLARGSSSDAGVAVQPFLVAPFPGITALLAPNGQPAARLGVGATPGDVLAIRGTQLTGSSVRVELAHRHLAAPHSLTPLAGSQATELRVQLPTASPSWPAGLYSLSVVVGREDRPEATTNALPLALAPRILSIAPNPAPRDGSGNVTLTVTCSPEVWPEQRVSLLVGDAEVRAEPHPDKTGTLTFLLEPAPVGQHLVRLRVDGVDSLLVDYSATPPAFDPSQRVTIS
ncbi:Pvc16 family protein [Myxococcus sp. RHSTA-1-4]|uniref:Pvc16 family protein n=1 Tax=Myxococcus sp. RHSTA-1-4 TaxID=2874601 RepID=UPI001CBCDDCD|nr:Pvc16 family protein [Myxococcus sp. RHSTA-1-4]